MNNPLLGQKSVEQRISELLKSANCGQNACGDDVPEKPKKMRRKVSDKTCKYFLPMRSPLSPLTHRCNDVNCEGGHRRSVDITNINWTETDADEPCSDDKCTHFQPKLYDFVLDDYEAVKDLLINNENKFKDNVMIRCPQYAILLDHVIAVIWYFYRDWQNWENFDIPQLEWAIKFLAGIFHQGTHDTFVDVETIRGHLEELLLINYAEVEGCRIFPCSCSATCSMSCKSPKPKCELDLPVSLKALFYRAPHFTNFLSRKRPSSSEMYDELDDRLSKTTRAIMKQVAFVCIPNTQGATCSKVDS